MTFGTTLVVELQHVMKLHIMQFSPSFCIVSFRRPKLTYGQAVHWHCFRWEHKIEYSSVKLERQLLEISGGTDFRVRNMSAYIFFFNFIPNDLNTLGKRLFENGEQFEEWLKWTVMIWEVVKWCVVPCFEWTRNWKWSKCWAEGTGSSVIECRNFRIPTESACSGLAL